MLGGKVDAKESPYEYSIQEVCEKIQMPRPLIDNGDKRIPNDSWWAHLQYPDRNTEQVPLSPEEVFNPSRKDDFDTMMKYVVQSNKTNEIHQRNQLNSLDGEDVGGLAIYGDQAVELSLEIKEAYKLGLFSRMPRGPIGSYLKVKDKSWGPAIEGIIGEDILRSYVVNSEEDRKVLSKLIEKVSKGATFHPTLTVTRFMDKVHEYDKYSVHLPGHHNVLDVLEVTDYLVTNCLVDMFDLESTLLVESPRTARELMMDETNVPTNCVKIVTKTGDTYYPDPNYRVYSGDDETEPKFIEVSAEEAKRRITYKIEECEKRAENTMAQKREIEKSLKQYKAAIEAARKVLDKLNERRESIKEKILGLE